MKMISAVGMLFGLIAVISGLYLVYHNASNPHEIGYTIIGFLCCLVGGWGFGANAVNLFE